MHALVIKIRMHNFLYNLDFLMGIIYQLSKPKPIVDHKKQKHNFNQ